MTIITPDTPSTLDRAAQEIIDAGRLVGQRGWIPATSGNLSRRLDHRVIAITASGTDKGNLTAPDILAISLDEPPPRTASAETPLHIAAYRRDPAIQSVLHIHSLNATLVSRRFAAKGHVTLSGFELLKAFAGIPTHDVSIDIPIFANSQDVPALAEEVEERLAHHPGIPGYLLAGHGLYAWGHNTKEALRHLEAFDFLFACLLAEGVPA